jgi:hypothetical protein
MDLHETIVTLNGREFWFKVPDELATLQEDDETCQRAREYYYSIAGPLLERPSLDESSLVSTILTHPATADLQDILRVVHPDDAAKAMDLLIELLKVAKARLARV